MRISRSRSPLIRARRTDRGAPLARELELERPEVNSYFRPAGSSQKSDGETTQLLAISARKNKRG
jgi:hypothetical protein